ncbi:gluconate 2-dehydrogenase subunit 3 family protein [Pseudemcibacter aquimaris]|uniref:gluconate 2-dehydrogenase subunit 3 family protein n=1 Tax=Pseudemcibacter aquimaris TaxID=2857064 RepID=UPI002013BF2F|nr:gluconate 2-dehydrogenase subunit 3 family protein [Pseudemcibacter aquimaris]MCC3860357.1 gluconate 2-dehydrogenase subunit 3 family protein [Pseudemcibacter aquimaris]WDU57683.1 gluconate 2-dehydrogenase subunit 3 family protein [Pseudemcibacter aquimaris]
MSEIDRRQLLKNIAIMTGGALSASVVSGVMSGAFAQERIDVDNPVFSDAELNLVAEMADMIIPDTDTPGAKAAKVHQYIHAIVGDWYYDDERATFMKGLHAVDSGFMNGSASERHAIMTKLDNEEAEEGKTFFQTFKELTLVGYFSSQIGAEQELRYEQYPGPYEGCVPFEKVGRTWAT